MEIGFLPEFPFKKEISWMVNSERLIRWAQSHEKRVVGAEVVSEKLWQLSCVPLPHGLQCKWEVSSVHLGWQSEWVGPVACWDRK